MTESGSDINFDILPASLQGMEEDPQALVELALKSTPRLAVTHLQTYIRSGRMNGIAPSDSFYGIILRACYMDKPVRLESFSDVSRSCYAMNIRYIEEINLLFENIGYGMTPRTSPLLSHLDSWLTAVLNQKQLVEAKRGTVHSSRIEKDIDRPEWLSQMREDVGDDHDLEEIS